MLRHTVQPLRLSLAPRLLQRTLTSSRPVSRQPTSPSLLIFDREHKRLQKDRAAADPTSSREVDYLRDEVARQLVDRLRDIKRRFPTLVELGAHSGHLRRHVNRDLTDRIVQCDLSSGILYRDQHEPASGPASASTAPFDRNDNPFPENSLDAVVSNLSLHWVNDLPGALIQIRRSLVPDGMFLGAMVGGDSLFELRTSLQLAELEREGGMSPRVSPMTDPRDMSDLLARAGFALTTVDVDEIVVNYPSALHVMQDLRAMGESNAIIRRRPYLPRDTLMAATSIYQALHGNEDGTVPA
ncbi:S-adenosyl-L-methionine-dependent methyltransferase, partial [Dimargaris cristalligena]